MVKIFIIGTNKKNRHFSYSQTGVSLPVYPTKSKKRYDSTKFWSKIKLFSGQRRFLSGSRAEFVEIKCFIRVGYWTVRIGKCSLSALSVTVSTIEEADEREDSFYLYEHEPFVEYKLEVKDIEGDKVRILLKAIVVEDGYAKPYTAASLEVDCWLKLE